MSFQSKPQSLAKPEEDTQARDILKKARTRLVISQPFFGMLALQLKLKQSHSLPTMGTDGTSLWYNPDFIKWMEANEGATVLRTAVTHEVLHCAFAHMARCGDRDQRLFNMAGDYVINNILKKSSNATLEFKLSEHWLYDSKYDDMSADEVYRLLKQEEQKKKDKGQNQSDDDGDEESNGGSGGDHADNNDHRGCGCGGMVKPTDENGNPLSEDEKKALEHKMKRTLAQAAQASKMQGNMPAGMERYIDDLLGYKVDWKSLLRQFIEEVAKNNFDWSRRSRRSTNMPYYMPSLHNLECGILVVAIDTSGSISQDELNHFGAELSGMLETVRPKSIHVIYVDTEVSSHQEFEPDDLPLKFEPTGGGGTRFSPAFDWVEEQGIEPKALIYMTDMCCNDFGEKPDYPVMWVTFEQNATPFGEPPFGEVIQMEMD